MQDSDKALLQLIPRVMMKMFNTFCVLLIPLFGASVIGGKILIVKNARIAIESPPNNPFFGEWSSEISESGDAVSIAFPAIADLPEDMMIRIVGEVNGDRIFFIEIGLCETFESGMADQNFIDHGYPKDEFPKSCPIKAGDYGVRNYTFTAENIPFEIPAGDFNIKYSLYLPNSEPLVMLTSEGHLAYK